MQLQLLLEHIYPYLINGILVLLYFLQQLDDVKVIGHITRPELGCKLVTRDGNEFDLKAQGWNPLAGEQ